MKFKNRGSKIAAAIISIIIILSGILILMDYLNFESYVDKIEQENLEPYKIPEYHTIYYPNGTEFNQDIYQMDFQGSDIVFLIENRSKNRYYGEEFWVMDIYGKYLNKIYKVQNTKFINNWFLGKTISFNDAGDRIIFITSDFYWLNWSVELLIKNGSTWDETCEHKVLYSHPTAYLSDPVINSDGSKIYFVMSDIIVTENFTQFETSICEYDITNGELKKLFTEGYEDKNYLLLDINQEDTKLLLVVYDYENSTEEIRLFDIFTNDFKKIELGYNDYFYSNVAFGGNDSIFYSSDRYSPSDNISEYHNLWMHQLNSSSSKLVLASLYLYEFLFSERSNILIFTEWDKTSYLKLDENDNNLLDTDNDGVVDLIDKYANDPKRGFYKHRDLNELEDTKEIKFMIFELFIFLQIIPIFLFSQLYKDSKSKKNK